MFEAQDKDRRESKKYSSKAASEEHYYQEILDCVPDMMLRLDTDFTIEWANAPVLQMNEDAIGKKCYEVFQDSNHECGHCPCARAMQENIPVEGFVAKEGTPLEGMYWLKCAIPILSREGENVGAVVIVKDAEDHFGTRARLETLTEEIDRERIKGQMHETKNRAMFYDMVESLKEIFETINNDIDRLRVIELYSDERDTIERLVSQSDRAYRKISNLHEIYDIEEGQLIFEVSTFSVGDFIDDLYHRFRFLSKKRNVDFSIQVDDNVPKQLSGDPIRLGNIVRNLVENAFEHTEHGSIQVQLGRVSIIDGRMKLRISIKDTGIGFSEEKLSWFSKISENPDPSDILSKLDDSTGLGYVTAMTLLSRMGGKLEIESTYGRGSEVTVFLYLDLIDKETTTSREKPTTPMKEVETNLKQKRKRILIADDDVMGRVSLKLMLQEQYDLDFARNGREVVEKYLNHRPDLVLMDIMMPQMNGFEAYDELEKHDHFRCPIIAVSAKVIESERSYLTGYGFDEHLPKPIDTEALNKILDKFFK
jgi:CheY-like chemotaxis protein/two-component sensor histidine kinase